MEHKRHREDSENRSRKHHKSHKKHSSRRSDSSDEYEEDRRHHHKKHRHREREAKYDPHLVIKQEKDDRNFEQQQRERSHHNERRRDHRRERDRNGGDHGLNSRTTIVKEESDNKGPEQGEDKQKPNFELSGKLTEDTNTFRGVVIKYNEPPEAMKPKRKWRLYPFKGAESLPVLHIHRQSAFLLGRERKIADIPVDHPSCSKQHAVLQYRAVPYQRPDGTEGRRVRPYIIDLESANGTLLNGNKMEPKRYYELKERDVIKFGFSSREYVLLHDKVDTSEIGDDSGED